VSQGQGGVFVNATLKLTYEPRTIRSSLAGELQRHLLGVIHRRNNNIGNSALYVDSPPGSISNLQGKTQSLIVISSYNWCGILNCKVEYNYKSYEFLMQLNL